MSAHRKTARLASWQVHTLVWTGLLLWLTGTVWLIFHFFGRVEGEFGLEINPLEHWMLRLHGFLIIPAYLMLGGLLIAHIPLGWKDRSQRPAGIALAALVIVLSISGYALYYVGSVTLREFTSYIHWIIGLAAPTIFYWHYRRRYAARRRKREGFGFASPDT